MVYSETEVYTVFCCDVNGGICSWVCSLSLSLAVQCFEGSRSAFNCHHVNLLFFPIQSLGDRHGENLSFEEGTGGLLHVDFNCLFDKGQTFEKPEVVPFRLTHNMIDAFGAYGYNG